MVIGDPRDTSASKKDWYKQLLPNKKYPYLIARNLAPYAEADVAGIGLYPQGTLSVQWLKYGKMRHTAGHTAVKNVSIRLQAYTIPLCMSQI